MNLLNKLTIKNLKLNKRRTIVTIIGIMLAVALINAVATMYFSGMASIIRAQKATSGDYHTVFYNVPLNDIKTIQNNRNVENITKLKYLGMSKIKTNNTQSPYVSVVAAEKDNMNKLGMYLVKGRLPENENEMVITNHLNNIMSTNYSIGDKLTLEIGDRYSKDNIKLKKSENLQDGEKIINTEKREFTIVGIVVDISESVNQPGEVADTVVTCLRKEDIKDNLDIFIRLNKEGLKKPYIAIGDMLGIDGNLYKAVQDDYATGRDATKSGELKEKFAKERKKAKYQFSSQRFLISLETDQKDTSFFGLRYVAAIAIGIIIFTSVFCIKNSFDISITEKNKQYGMLRSIGATKKQVRKNVLFEATILALIGIPLGIFLGYFASFILVKISNMFLKDLVVTQTEINFELIFDLNWMSAAISALLGMVTIYLSSLRIARKAAKVSPINSIRNSADIKIKSKKLKVPKLIKSIFKIGGEISYKNMKRNKKRYRVTVISIVLSIMVYISLTAFMQIMLKQLQAALGNIDYDISCHIYKENDEEITKLNNIAKTTEGVTEYTLLQSDVGKYDKKFLNKEIKQISENFPDNETVSIIAVGDIEYNKYIKSLGLNYNDIKDKAILIDTVSTATIDASKKPIREIRMLNLKENDKFDVKRDNGEKLTFEIAKITKKRPFATNEDMVTPYKILVLSNEYYNKIFKDEKRYSAYYKIKDASKVKTQIEESLKDYKKYFISNVQERYNNEKHLITLVAIFLYGFIIIIILIGVTNIINTITTSMELRKQEFAILRSVGMTNKEFNRMIRLETLFIGIKSLFFGIPLGTAIAYGIYQVGKMPFEIPLKPILYSAIAVIVLIASIMQYSLVKIKKQNTIETIRNENI
ncbi:MAG: ABC transporter permease [Clostridiales bacterium]|nr:ABC transporter permease [Clostridiales bacterium]